MLTAGALSGWAEEACIKQKPQSGTMARFLEIGSDFELPRVYSLILF